MLPSSPNLEKAAIHLRAEAAAVAKAHERTHQGNGPDRLDLGVYVRDICQDLNDATPLRHIEVVAEPGIIGGQKARTAAVMPFCQRYTYQAPDPMGIMQDTITDLRTFEGWRKIA